MSKPNPPPHDAQPVFHDAEVLTRCSELETTLRHHHGALHSFERDLMSMSLMEHHVREAMRLVALAVGQLYIARSSQTQGTDDVEA